MSILIKGYVEREQALDVIDLADFIADERGLLLDADSVQACLLDIPSADVVKGSDFRDCRNELCLKCGRYTEKHLGACDGCRWESGRWLN